MYCETSSSSPENRSSAAAGSDSSRIAIAAMVQGSRPALGPSHEELELLRRQIEAGRGEQRASLLDGHGQLADSEHEQPCCARSRASDSSGAVREASASFVPAGIALASRASTSSDSRECTSCDVVQHEYRSVAHRGERLDQARQGAGSGRCAGRAASEAAIDRVQLLDRERERVQQALGIVVLLARA